MNRIIVGLVIPLGLVALATGSVARAGGPCVPCRKTAAGSETPFGDTGCGPRYCGAKHDECWAPDACDACGRWQGCNGVRQSPEKFPPWQLPPGRGFQNGQDVGYRAACGSCNPCAPKVPWIF